MKVLLVTVILCGASVGCSRSHNNNAQGEDDAFNPDRWKPTAEAIESAKREKNSTIAQTTQPRASDYDLNPRAAMQAQQNEETVPGYDSRNPEQANDEDPALGQMEKLPPPPMPLKLGSGDEADQFGLPEWERMARGEPRMARGELHAKRIRY
ncbi:MAG: hypothetical protein QOG67_3850 [Verrucomicrobiota bacterium]